MRHPTIQSQLPAIETLLADIETIQFKLLDMNQDYNVMNPDRQYLSSICSKLDIVRIELYEYAQDNILGNPFRKLHESK